jgi:hypothetical protein
LVFLLEELRKRLEVSITIVSGYRCPINNSKVGGAKERHVPYLLAPPLYSAICLQAVQEVP